MHYYILTGTSRGIGAALATALLEPENALFCISRGDNPELRAEAVEAGCRLRYLRADLSQSFDTQHLMQVILAELDHDEAESITVIHNAGQLTPMGPVGEELSLEALSSNVNVNLLSPMLMTQTFVNRVQEWEIPKRVLVISSGAARKPRAGWSAYCSTKAGLEMFAQCLAEEQQDRPYPVRVVSLAPGVVDTTMQDLIREQDEETLPSVSRFHQLKAEQQLWDPAFVADEILRFLGSISFGEKGIMDLRDIVADSRKS